MNQILNCFRFKFNYLLYFTARRGGDYLHHEDDVSQCKIKRRRIRMIQYFNDDKKNWRICLRLRWTRSRVRLYTQWAPIIYSIGISRCIPNTYRIKIRYLYARKSHMGRWANAWLRHGEKNTSMVRKKNSVDEKYPILNYN